MLLNAPGVKPTPERVEDVARRSLGLDEAPDEVTPPFYPPVLEKFLTDNPADDHFLLELPEKRDPSRGGNGFGSVTCMEDECWVDTNLSADPDQPDGGRENGLGSFYEYAVHCQEDRHVRGRSKRLNENGITLPPRAGASSAVLPQDIADSQAHPSSSQWTAPFNAEAGPSGSSPSAAFPLSATPQHQTTLPSNPHPSAPSRMQTQSNILQDHNVNIPAPSTVPKSKGKARAISVDSDSDDEILFLGATSPTRRIVVVDSDDEVKPLRSSQSSRASQPARPWIPAWSAMALTERRQAVSTELSELSKPPVHPSFDRTRAVARRKDALAAIKDSNYLMQWTPPENPVLEAYPDLALHPKLNDTFERPPRIQPPAGPSFAHAGQAGPSSIPDAGSSAPPHNHTGYVPAFLQSVWKGVDKVARLQHTLKEMQMLRAALLKWRSHPSLQSLVTMVEARYVQMSQALGSDNATWSPPSRELLRCLPQLRDVVHPALAQFLPVDAQPPAQMNEELLEEWDRPMGRDLHAFFQDALEDFKEDITVEEGLKVLRLDAISDKIPGANFTLMPHQVLGVQFMVKREERASVRGGLLCDAMGLGKTVQCIALMLLRDERPEDFRKCPQLIVAPLALLLQWKTEIETKTTKGWRIVIHHGQSRATSAAALRNYDIVLTTYGTLMSESGLSSEEKKKKKKRPVGSDEESEEEERRPRRKKGPLFGVKWFRVILDEAHNCRNKRTRTARAVLLLDCLHPWPITGSPVVNTLADLGVALEFIGAMDLKDYQHRVVLVEKKKPRLAAKRCQAIMKPLMFRRNKDTMLNGRKILELPPKITNMAWLNFEMDERAIYAAIEQRAKVRVNKYIQRGTLMKNYTVVLALLTRLRQCVNHPWLLRRKPGEERREDDLLVDVDDDAFGANLSACRANDEDEYGRAVALLGPETVSGIKEKLKERYERMTDEDEDCKENQDMECSICYEPFDGTELVTPCGHIYCKQCLENLFTQPARDGTELNDDDIQSGNRSCPMCRSMLVPGKVFRAAAIYGPSTAGTPADEAEEEVEEVDKKPQIDRKGKKRAAESFFDALRDDKKPRLGEGPSRATTVTADGDDVDELEDIKEKVPPSSKLSKLLDLVMGYLREDPTVKILVFSQFVQFLDLVYEFLHEEGIKCLHYRGAMSQNQREEALRRFSTPPAIADSIPIMLISTKAGGVGLNLTMASKVIMCDLAWNPATENQAVDRAHRIGQNNEVQVERLLIRDTVEDRLLEIQERKGLLADGALGEGDVGRLGRLNIDDIRRLFAIDRDMGRDDE